MENKYPLVSEEDKVKFSNYSEVNTYFLIDECGAFIWRMNHEMIHGRIPEEQHKPIREDMERISQMQQVAVDSLKRFDIDPESSKDRENGDYWKWYNHWNNWKNGLTNEQWNKVNNLLSKEESIDEYLPEGTWKDENKETEESN